MKENKRIVLMLIGDESWMGGVYYVLNILKCLTQGTNVTNEAILVIYNDHVPKAVMQEVFQIPGIRTLNISEVGLIDRIINWFSKRLLGVNYILTRLFRKHQSDVVYPILDFDESIHYKEACTYWIYDFQHQLLPSFFTDIEIARRDSNFQLIAQNASKIVVSSEDAKQHFQNKYPESKADLKVLRFSSIVDESALISEAEIRSKFGLKRPYFMVSNQFWSHKNHLLVIDAILKLKQSDCADFDVVFTGNSKGKKQQEVVSKMSQMMSDHALENIRLVGFISRGDQLSLMRSALAVIQPSRFEGWGTVVEDAKALNVPVIASTINVHKEQLGELADFFGVDDSDALSRLMKKHLIEPKQVVYPKLDFENEILNALF